MPFGIFLVRSANFVNAELYGRIAPASLPWAMRFPTDPAVRTLAPELARAGALNWHAAYERAVADGTWARIVPQVPLRHPSQLYEALLEGMLTAAVLWWVYARRSRGARTSGPTDGPTLRPGAIAALFLLCYGVARFLVEFTREPDAQLGFVFGPLTMGQLLSFGVLGGAALIYWWPTRTDGTFSPSRPAL